MKEENNQDNSLQFKSFGAVNDVSRLGEEAPNPHFLVAAGRNGNQWTCIPKSSENYVEYLAEASPYLPKLTTEDMLQSICSPVGSTPAFSGVTETQKNMFYCDARKACGPKPADSSIDIDVPKCFQQILSWTPDNQCDQADKLSRTQHHILTENLASWPQESIGHNYNVSLHHTRETVAAPGSSSKQQPSLSKQKSIATDRQRRERISEKLNALHELLPHPAEGGQASVVDDIIDHVKHLQLQIKASALKPEAFGVVTRREVEVPTTGIRLSITMVYNHELSQRKLGGESTAIPLVFREGYGHYINQQMSSEPLEEMMAKLLEEHPMTAAQLLETKGLFLLPIALVEDSSKAF